MSMITLEDINTWLMKYEYQTLIFTLDCNKPMGNYGIYSIEGGNIRTSYVRLYLPENVKVYYPSGGISYNEQRDWIILQDGDWQLTVALTVGGEDVGGTTKFRKFDWCPISPTKCLRLTNDYLEHRKLFLNIDDSNITSINYKQIKDLNTDNPYVTYGDIYNSLSDTVLWSNIDEGSRYPFKIINIPSCPHITVEKELYKGNNNSLDDLISLPSDDIEYKIYYNGKELNDNLFIPVDFEEDSIRLRVVTKSYEPYVSTDVYIDVPVKVKLLLTIEDLNNYTYGKLTTLSEIYGEINNDIIIHCEANARIFRCELTINGRITFENIKEISNSTKIINNSYLEFKAPDNSDFIISGGTGNSFHWINNGDLIIDGAEIEGYDGFLLNNGSVEIVNSKFNYASSFTSLPILHSTTSNVELRNNEFIFDDEFAFKGYQVCVIRANDFDVDKFLMDNTTSYNCTYLHDEKTYNITGNGVAYCLIDEDTIRFNKLEVSENV